MPLPMLPGLFSPPVDDPRTINRKRDEAMQRVGQNAEDRRAGFLVDAERFVETYLRTHGVTSGEQLTLACKHAGIIPHDDRAFGPVYANLVRRGVIERVGMVRRERGHGTAGGNLWNLKGRA